MMLFQYDKSKKGGLQLEKQLTLFFGELPGKTVKKDGKNVPVSQRRFEPLKPERIDIRFSNTTATQFGGYPLWDHFLRGLKLKARLAHHIKINRGENGFTAPELSRFFIDTRILGAARLAHVAPMRFDPMLTLASGIDGLPSNVTLGRYFKSYTQGNLESSDHLNVWLNSRCWKRARSKRQGWAKDGQIIVDYDSSTMTVYGKQQGADRGRCFRKKDNPGFQPKFAFIGGLGVMVNQQLYPQSFNLPKGFEAFHKETVSKLPKTARIWAIRGDGALYSEQRIRWCERKGYTYAVSAMRTPHLLGAIPAIREHEWKEAVEEGGSVCSVARITYRPKTWQEARTFIISRRLRDLKGQQVLWDSERYKYFAYVTDYDGTPLEQFKFCVQRCSLENFIKESKRGFHYDFLPHQELDANRAYLAHVQMAYNLAIWWKVLRAPAGVNRWTVETVRRRILSICGNLRRRAGRWTLSLPRRWPWKSVYRELAAASGLPPP
jgi:hypothetical protein